MTSSTASAARSSVKPSGITRKRIGATLLIRDGFTCQYVADSGTACGRTVVVGGSPADGFTFERGHIKSHANGGTWTVANMVTLCRRCNAAIGSEDIAPANLARPVADMPLVSAAEAEAIVGRQTNMEPLV